MNHYGHNVGLSRSHQRGWVRIYGYLSEFKTETSGLQVEPPSGGVPIRICLYRVNAPYKHYLVTTCKWVPEQNKMHPAM